MDTDSQEQKWGRKSEMEKPVKGGLITWLLLQVLGSFLLWTRCWIAQGRRGSCCEAPAPVPPAQCSCLEHSWHVN